MNKQGQKMNLFVPTKLTSIRKIVYAYRLSAFKLCIQSTGRNKVCA